MDLPKTHLKSAKGQILILFLLVLVVGVAIVLSVASRTITDIRTTTTSDESNRAYFAAEAGIEEALQQLQSGGVVPDAASGGLKTSFPTVNTEAVTADVTPTAGSAVFVYPEDVKKDDVVQVALLEDFLGDVFDPLNLGWSGTNLDFYWSSSSDDSSAETPAVEISVVYYCPGGTCPGFPAGQSFGVSKIAFDPYTTRGPKPNNFCTNVEKAGPYTFPGESKEFYFKATVNVFQGVGNENCNGLKLDATNTKPVLARVRLLYNSTLASPVAVESPAPNPPLPLQGTVLESTGTTSSGVTRKLQVTRLYPALPALFDYVLFSGSTLSK
ncbi:MAG: hypothetical protein A2126_03365 [Candidatus Woykebacteria bacterium GWB1_45_5]|uniref:Type 4 fimbrial biogenesis protein PilX N-terminal domain-containing protein n=2 Tax=Candidatus Woykeibacteriota TaxID=1817899 RepID=A0A1G1W3S5_9BACT|nr:MAG: hypothetical protein A2113_03130 [Candidatus Woykebacteria bacterium GWA1_44_8]OGY24462.1 MAG: hypothetical protein A2126_03365 [Candidatus Woykebacteria bacterium GWB1_45_5]